MRPELVERARRGDQDAYGALIGEAIDRLYAAASLILHDRTLAEDAVQETMIRAWRDLPKLRDVARFDVWLRRVLVHTCIDLARSARGPRSELKLMPEIAAPGDLAIQSADRDAVARAFAELTPAHRAVLVMRHYFGHSLPEVAEALGLPLGTAKSRLSRAEAAMRAALETDGRRVAEGGTA